MSSRGPLQLSTLAQQLVRRHLLVGWLGLLVFLTLGIVLETFHGLKASYYLDARHSTRRLVWTLAHSHGTLFSIINIAFALSLYRIDSIADKALRLASPALIGALLLLPLGFFLGGVQVFGGDPGVGILLVPLGAAALLIGVGAFWWGLRKSTVSPDKSTAGNH